MHMSPSHDPSIASDPYLSIADAETLILTREDIRQMVLQTGLDVLMDEMIARLTAAMSTFRAEDASIPSRQGFRYTHPAPGLIEWMPCMSDGGGRATIKIVGYHPSNSGERNLPTILSTVSAYDTTSGHLICMMDATLITALRTGAVSAIASRLMASPRSTTLGIIGAGAQAVTQLHAVSRVLDIDRVVVYDHDPFALSTFPLRTRTVSGHLDVKSASCDQVVESADVLCTVTSVGVGDGPVFNGVEPKPWLHVNAVGSDLPGKTELPLALLHRSFVCPDFRNQAIEEGECQLMPPEKIGPNLFELVQNSEKYRFVQEGLSVFDSTGWTLEDEVAMTLFMELAAEFNLGMQLPIENVTTDALNPYHFAT